MKIFKKSASALALAALALGMSPGAISAQAAGFTTQIASTSCPGQKKVCHNEGGKLVCTCDGPIRT